MQLGSLLGYGAIQPARDGGIKLRGQHEENSWHEAMHYSSNLGPPPTLAVRISTRCEADTHPHYLPAFRLGLGHRRTQLPGPGGLQPSRGLGLLSPRAPQHVPASSLP